MKNKTLATIWVLGFILIGIVGALSINYFSDLSTSGNLTFSGNQNITKNFSINRYANVTSASLNLTGFSDWKYTGVYYPQQNGNSYGIWNNGTHWMVSNGGIDVYNLNWSFNHSYSITDSANIKVICNNTLCSVLAGNPSVSWNSTIYLYSLDWVATGKYYNVSALTNGNLINPHYFDVYGNPITGFGFDGTYYFLSFNLQNGSQTIYKYYQNWTWTGINYIIPYVQILDFNWDGTNWWVAHNDGGVAEYNSSWGYITNYDTTVNTSDMHTYTQGVYNNGTDMFTIQSNVNSLYHYYYNIYKFNKSSYPTNSYLSINNTNVWNTKCYQESANTSNQSGTDGNCGLSYTGSYLSEGTWSTDYKNISAVYDGNYNTFGGSSDGYDANVTINYTKPSNSNSAIWQVKDMGSVRNISIPSSCFNYDISKLQLKVFSSSSNMADYYVAYYCLNSSGWNLLDIDHTNEYFYEEAMWWDVSPNKIQTNNFSSILNTAINNGACNCNGCSLLGVNCTIPFLFHSDTAGILQYSSLNVTYDLDQINPLISISLPVNNSNISNSTVQINFTASDDKGISFCWSTKDGGVTNTSRTCTNNTIATFNDTYSEGQNNITIYVNDTSANINSSTIYFKVDTVAPVITIFSPLTQEYHDQYNYTIQLNVSASDATTSISTYRYSLNGAANISFTPNTTIILLAGVNNLTVYVNDSANNLGSSTVHPNLTFTPKINDINISNSSISYDRNNLTSGLVGYWKFDQNNTNQIDSSGNENNGTVIANAIFNNSGKIGASYSFNGSGGYIQIPRNRDKSLRNETISAWVMSVGPSANTTSGNIGIVVDIQEAEQNPQLGLYGNSAGTQHSCMVDISGSVSSGILTLGQWYYLTCVFEENGTAINASLYRNGIYIGSYIHSGTSFDYFTNYTKIGVSKTAYNRYFNGSIDEVRIYNRSLSASEISQLYQITNPTFQEYPNITITANITDEDTPQSSLYYSWFVDSVSVLTGFAQNVFNWIFTGSSNQVQLVVNDSNNYNVTQNWNITTTFVNPLISFVSPTQANNTNISQSYIFINVSVTEANPKNITFRLFNSSNYLLNSTNYLMTNQTSNNTINFTNLADGIYYYNVTIYDLVGNSNSTSTYQIRLDTTPPTTTASATSPVSGPAYTFNTWTNTSVRVTLSAVDLGIGFNNLAFPVYCVDTSNTCTPSTFIGSGVTIATEGTSYIRYYSNDTLNNKETTQNKTIKIDTTSPSISILYPTPNLNISYNTSIPLNFSVADSSSGLSTCKYNLDNGVNTTISCSANTTFSTSEGAHTLYLFVNDSVGNINSTNVTFRTDLSGPLVTILSPANTTYRDIYSYNYSLNVSASDSGIGVISTYWYSLNGGTNTSFTPNITLTGLIAGSNTIKVYANDTLGNTNSTTVVFYLGFTPKINDISVSNVTNGYLTFNNMSESAWKYANLGINLTGQTFTYAAWVYPTAVLNTVNNYDGYIFVKPGWHQGLALTNQSNTMKFKANIETTTHSGGAVVYSNAISLNQWYFVAMTVDNATKTVKLYVNKDIYTGTWTTIQDDYPAITIKLGSASGTVGANWSDPFGGSIDNPMIYNRTLSASEISQLYLAGLNYNLSLSSDTSLVGYWNLNELSGTSILDSSSYSHTGTLINSPTRVSNGQTYERNTTSTNNGLVGYWKFDKNWSVQEDSSGLIGANATEVGSSNPISWTPNGKIGGAYTFNGAALAGNCLAINGLQSRLPTANITIMAWSYAINHSASSRFIKLSASNGNTQGIQFQGSNSILLFVANGSTVINTPGVVEDLNQWNFWVGTFDGNTLNLYKNGILSATNSFGVNTAIVYGAESNRIGCFNTNDAVYNGSIDEVRIYNRTLSASEISSLYQVTNPTFQEYVNATLNATITDEDTPQIALYYRWLVDNVQQLAGIGQSVFNWIFTKSSTQVDLYVNDSQNYTVHQNWNITTTFINPTINFTAPTPNNNSYIQVNNFYVNFTGTEANLNDSWITNNNVNYTSTCVGTSPYYCYYNFTSLGEGAYNYQAFIRDKVGNVNQTEIRKVTIDTVVPTINFIAPTPANDTVSNSTSIVINVTGTEINPFTVTISWVYLGGETNHTTTCSGNSPYFCYDTISGIGPDNPRYYHVHINDSAGNTNVTEIRSYIYDSTNPLISYSTGTPSEGANLSQTNIYVNVSITETNFANITFNLFNSTNLVNSTNYTTLINSINWTNLPNTDYVYNITIFDRANNHNSTLTRSIRLDTGIPNATLILPTNNSINNSASLNYTANLTDNLGIKNATLNIYNSTGLVNQTTISFVSNTIQSVVGIVVTLVDNTYTWFYTIFDWAGNNYQSGNNTVSIDSTNPSLIILSPSNGTKSTDTHLAVNYTVSDVHLSTCGWKVNLGANNPITCGTNITGQTWSQGLNNVTITAIDTYGNSNSTSVIFFIDNVAPVLTITNPNAYFPTFVVNLNWFNYTLTDAGVGLSTCWWKNETGNNLTVTCNQNFTFNQSSGAHHIYFWANDTLGNLVSSDTIYSISTDKPSVNLVYPVGTWFNDGQNINFNFTAQDPNNLGIVNCSLYGNFSGSWELNQSNTTSTSDGNIVNYNFINNLTDGGYIWNALCYNTGYSSFANANATFYIDTVNPLISFIPPTENNATNKSQTFIQENVSIIEANLKNITYNLYNLTSLVNSTTYSSNIDSIIFSNLPNAIYYYNVTICDQAGNCNSTETRTITLDNLAPTITIQSPLSQNYANNNSVALNYTVTDNLIGVKECWYYVYNSNGSLEIPTQSLASCENTTFALPGGDIDYTLTLFSQDYLNNIQASAVNFGIRTISPAIVLSPVNNTYSNTLYNHLFGFTVSTNAGGISSCQLWADFNGTWELNQTKTSIISNGITINYFNPVNITEGIFNWNVNCSDILGNNGYAFANETYTTDITYPNVNISLPLTNSTVSTTFDMNYNITDTNLYTCYYNLIDSNGTWYFAPNQTLVCGSGTRQSIVSAGTYNLYIWGIDKAGNLNSTYVTITAQAPSPPSGGGGGGGGSTVVNITQVYNNTFCGDKVCQVAGNDLGVKEDYFTCSQDCPPANLDTVVFGCFSNDPAAQCVWQQLSFKYIGLLIGLLILVLAFSTTEYQGRQVPLYRYIVIKSKIARRRR